MSCASFRTAPSHQPYKVDYPESSRQSYSEPPDAIFQGQPSRSYSRPNSNKPQESDQDPIVRGVQYSNQQIPHGVYEPPIPPNIYSTPRGSSKGQYSPTASDMDFRI